VDCIEGAVEYFAEAGELAKMAMAELDATKGELAQLKEALSAAQLDQIFCFTLGSRGSTAVTSSMSI